MRCLWVIGPPAAGKSTLVERAGFADVIDQDAELERMAAGDWSRLAELRPIATARAWARVPVLRAAGTPLVIEVTGDKPELLAAEVRAGHAAGYVEIGVGLRRPLELCLARNRARKHACCRTRWSRRRGTRSSAIWTSIGASWMGSRSSRTTPICA